MHLRCGHFPYTFPTKIFVCICHLFHAFCVFVPFLLHFIHSFIHQWLFSPLLGPDLFFSSVIIFYTDGRTPWTSDQPVARPLPTQRATQTQNKRTHRHPCLEWDSNPQSQRSSERRRFMP
jgi:hypothetical protein